jgi:hypothetical protein
METAEALNRLAACGTQHGVHLVDAELVVAGRHWRMCREYAGLCNGIHVGLRRLLQRRGLQPLLQQADAKQRRMALIHVVDLGVHPERPEHRNARQAEYGLLTQAIVSVSAVQVIGEAAVVRIIALEVGVEQEHWNDVPGHADHIEAPRAHSHFAALHLDADDLACAGQRRLRCPRHVRLGLLANGIQVLTEVSAAMDQ